MTYLDRQKKAQWTSPRGKSFMLNLTKNFEYTRKHIGEVSENPYGGDVFEDQGVGGRAIPLNISFNGNDHDREADAFEKAFNEKGKSKLQLPYGSQIIVNAISLTRKYSLTKNISSTVFNVNFHETGESRYPKSYKSQKANIALDIEELQIQASSNLAEKEIATSDFKLGLNSISESFGEIQDNNYNAIITDIEAQLSTNTFSPDIIANQAGILLNKGFNAKNSFQNVIGNLNSMINTFTQVPSSLSQLFAYDFFSKLAITSAGSSLLNSNYETRQQAVETAEKYQDIYFNYKKFIEIEASKILTLEDTLIQENNINSLVQNIAGVINEDSFDLKIEQKIILAESTNLINIAYKYYPDDFIKNPDETIAYIAKTNDFIDDDFLHLEKDREILIYV